MSAASSAQRGPLLPSPGLFRFAFGIDGLGWGQGYTGNVEPLDGTTLDDFLQKLVAGITGLPTDRVVPRFQEDPPNFPAGDEWAAVGATDHAPEDDGGLAYAFHDGAASGRDFVRQHETFVMLLSSYGPRADRVDALVRDGLQVAQNREVLQLAAMGLVRLGPSTLVPRLVGQRWRRRVERRITFRRMVQEVYPVLNLLSASIGVTAATDGDVDLATVDLTVASPDTT